MQKTNKLLLFLFSVLCVFCCAASPVFAAQAQKFVISSDFELNSGEKLNGDLIIVAGNADLKTGSEVDGDVMVFGGNLFCDGTIDGDITAFAGHVKLDENAFVNGDLTGVAAHIFKSPGVVINGNSLESRAFHPDSIFDERFNEYTEDGVIYPDPEEFDEAADLPAMPEYVSQSSGIYQAENAYLKFTRFFTGIVISVFRVLVMSACALLIMLLLKNQTLSCVENVDRLPLQSVGIGFLVMILFIVMEITLTLTLVLIPLALIFAVVYIALSTFGLITVGYSVGTRLGDWLHIKRNDVLFAVIGTFCVRLITILSQRFIPCFGFIPGLFVTVLGIGAVIGRICGLRPSGSGHHSNLHGSLPDFSVRDHEEDPLEPAETSSQEMNK